MTGGEQACVLEIAGEQVVGLYHPGERGRATAVLIVVGGPQYRIGSHRQFVLLARALAAAGFPVLRFDYRGIGDSDAVPRDFEDVDTDVRAAVDRLLEDSGAREVAIWGLCDAASAALMYAAGDARIAALVLANPWVHSPATEAQVRLKTYYAARLSNPDFWRRLVRGQVAFRDSMSSLGGYVSRSLRRGRDPGRGDFIVRMREGLESFRGDVYLLMSGDDLVAAEFRELCKADSAWRRAVASRIRATRELDEANHTFSRAEWRAEVEAQTIAWLEGRENDA